MCTPTTSRKKQATAVSFLMSRGARAHLTVSWLVGTLTLIIPIPPINHPQPPQDQAGDLLPLHLAAVGGHASAMEALLGLPFSTLPPSPQQQLGFLPPPPPQLRRFDPIVPLSPYVGPAARTASGATPLHLGMLLMVFGSIAWALPAHTIHRPTIKQRPTTTAPPPSPSSSRTTAPSGGGGGSNRSNRSQHQTQRLRRRWRSRRRKGWRALTLLLPPLLPLLLLLLLLRRWRWRRRRPRTRRGLQRWRWTPRPPSPRPPRRLQLGRWRRTGGRG